MKLFGGGCICLVFYVLICGFIGYQVELMFDICGLVIFNCLFYVYEFYKGLIIGCYIGVFLFNGIGEVVVYVFFNLEDCGLMMVELGIKVYLGMIVGEYICGNDLEVNVLKGKQLINICFVGKDDVVKFIMLIKLILEVVFFYIVDDELVEVILKLICLCKVEFDFYECKCQECVLKKESVQVFRCY